MLNELDILEDVSKRLDSAGIPYMLTGSMAMIVYAEPRMTRDVDVVVALAEEKIDAVVDLFAEDYIISAEAVAESIRHRTMFNIIHAESVVKVDFIIRKQTPYRIAEFENRRRLRIDGFETWVVAAEDLILSKLEWLRDTGWQVQRADIAGLLEGEVDHDYIDRWAKELDLTNLLDEVRNG